MFKKPSRGDFTDGRNDTRVIKLINLYGRKYRVCGCCDQVVRINKPFGLRSRHKCHGGFYPIVISK